VLTEEPAGSPQGARTAKDSVLTEVAGARKPAGEVVAGVQRGHPELNVDEIRAAMWELVGNQDLLLGWDGALERGEAR
jgi:hypothetical protein